MLDEPVTTCMGKLLFTWLSLVISMIYLFVLSVFPRDVLDEVLNLIESVSEGFPTYSCDCGKHWTFSTNFIDKSSIFKHEYLI